MALEGCLASSHLRVVGTFALCLLAASIAACGGCGDDDESNDVPASCADLECSANATCVDDECRCNPGYEGDGLSCEEVMLACESDETCGAHGTCSDGFCTCENGYALTTSGCADADECAAGTHDCDPAAICTNTDGSFTCSCPGDSEGDGRSCEPFDECASGAHDCVGDHAVCIDLDEGFECGCEDGYTGDSTRCSVLVDCDADPDACDDDATCTDTPDGTACICDEGFAGDGTTCSQTRFTTLSTTEGRVCGLRPDGTMACWGSRAPGGDESGRTYGVSRPLPEPSGYSWTALDVSNHDVCGVRDDGTIWCAIREQSFAQIGAETDWVDIKTANTPVGGHFCARKTDETLWCWGTNSHGQVGIGGTDDVDTPTQIGTAAWKTVDVGVAYSCGVHTDGTLWCWGGAGPLSEEIWSDVPQQVGTDSDWSSVTIEGFDNRALKEDGRVYGWRGHVAMPERDGTESWRSFGHASAGTNCGVKPDGTLWCRGINQFGVLGVEGITVSETFVQIGTASDWSEVMLGASHACALKESGDAYCWGRNDRGQVGVGTLPTRLEPSLIAPGVSHTAVALGHNHTCVVSAGGALACTGTNAFGAAGFPPMEVFALREYRVVDPGPWDAVAVGGNHTCALRGGRLSCFGAGNQGQLGTGSAAAPTHVPTEVDDPDGWAEVFAGPGTTCALKDDGALYCWGDNRTGRLGVGDTEPRYVPTRVGSDTWKSVAIDNFIAEHTCALRSDDTLWCWGSNESGELGTGDMMPSTTPVQVGEAAWKSAAVGYQSTLGVQADGTLWWWGNLSPFSPASDPLLTPERIGSDANWSTVAATQQNACALRDDGALFCWGHVYGGATGQPDTSVVIIEEPMRVGSDTDWTQIHVTRQAACGLKAGGELLCWGSENSGSLGYGTSWYPTPQRIR